MLFDVRAVARRGLGRGLGGCDHGNNHQRRHAYGQCGNDRKFVHGFLPRHLQSTKGGICSGSRCLSRKFKFRSACRRVLTTSARRAGRARRYASIAVREEDTRRVTPEPVIGPRFARTRWPNPPALLRRTCCPAKIFALPGSRRQSQRRLERSTGKQHDARQTRLASRTGRGRNPHAATCPSATASTHRAGPDTGISRAAKSAHAASCLCRPLPAAVATVGRVRSSRWCSFMTPRPERNPRGFR